MGKEEQEKHQQLFKQQQEEYEKQKQWYQQQQEKRQDHVKMMAELDKGQAQDTKPVVSGEAAKLGVPEQGFTRSRTRSGREAPGLLLKAGARVVIAGLQARPDFNGQVVNVIGEKDGRIEVTSPDGGGHTLALKSDRLLPARSFGVVCSTCKHKFNHEGAKLDHSQQVKTACPKCQTAVEFEIPAEVKAKGHARKSTGGAKPTHQLAGPAKESNSKADPELDDEWTAMLRRSRPRKRRQPAAEQRKMRQQQQKILSRLR